MKKKTKYISIVCFIWLFAFFVLMIIRGINQYENEQQKKMRLAIQESEETRKQLKAKRKACRDPWEGKERVPIIGGGWVDTKKIPYDFILMKEDEDGICRATGIMESFFYWDGEKIIPRHDEFLGVSSEDTGDNSVASVFKSWASFSIVATFRNQHETEECKKRGGSYTHNIYSGCVKLCKEKDGFNIIKQGKCVVNLERWKNNIPLSRRIKSDIYPDLEMILDNEDRPYFSTYGWGFIFSGWPYGGKIPIIMVNNLGFDNNAINNMTIDQLKSFDLGKVSFNLNETTAISQNFYFYGGKAQPRVSNMSLHEVSFFLRKLHDYLSDIVIKEFNL